MKDDEQRAVLESLRDPVTGKHFIVYDLWDYIVYDAARLRNWLDRLLTPRAAGLYIGGPGRGVWMPSRDEWEKLVEAVDKQRGINHSQQMEIDDLQARLAGYTLADITRGNLGLVTAGEFRAGNGGVPGDDFTGARMYYDPVNHIGYFETQNAGTKQFYSDSAGKVYAGAGEVLLDADGITIATPAAEAAQNRVDWSDGAGGVLGKVFTITTGSSPNRNAQMSVHTSGEGTGKALTQIIAGAYSFVLNEISSLCLLEAPHLRLTTAQAPIQFADSNTEVWEDASSNLSFKDANAGTTTLTGLSMGALKWAVLLS